jgi:small subunit ribosomal protein S9
MQNSKSTKQETTIYCGTGLVNKSTARVKLLPGTGKLIVNNRKVCDYFPPSITKELIMEPLDVTLRKGSDNFDVVCTVIGGGYKSQALAIRHGIAKALVSLDPYNKTILKRKGLLCKIIKKPSTAQKTNNVPKVSKKPSLIR